jgi:hypothetical protein
MNIEQWWNDADREKLKVTGDDCGKYRLVHHKYRME